MGDIVATVQNPLPQVTAEIGPQGIVADTIANPLPNVTAEIGPQGIVADTIANPLPNITAEIGPQGVVATVQNPLPEVTAEVAVGGGDLNAEDRAKLNSIEVGAQRNKDVIKELVAYRAPKAADQVILTNADVGTFFTIAETQIDRNTWNAGGRIQGSMAARWTANTLGGRVRFNVILEDPSLEQSATFDSGLLATSTTVVFEFNMYQGSLDDGLSGSGHQHIQGSVGFVDDTGAQVSTTAVSLFTRDFKVVGNDAPIRFAMQAQVLTAAGTDSFLIDSATVYQYGYRELTFGPFTEEA